MVARRLPAADRHGNRRHRELLRLEPAWAPLGGRRGVDACTRGQILLVATFATGEILLDAFIEVVRWRVHLHLLLGENLAQ